MTRERRRSVRAERRRARAHHRRRRSARHRRSISRGTDGQLQANTPTRDSTSSRSRSRGRSSTSAWRCSAHSGRLSPPHPRLRLCGIPRQVHSGEFPDPATGQFITVEWYDNLDPVDTGRSGIRTATASCGWSHRPASVKRATRVISEVERTWFTMSLPRGIPLWAGGNLLSNGGGNNPKIEVEVPPPSDITTTVQVGGTSKRPTSRPWASFRRQAAISTHSTGLPAGARRCAGLDREGQRPLLHLARLRAGQPVRRDLEPDRRFERVDIIDPPAPSR